MLYGGVDIHKRYSVMSVYSNDHYGGVDTMEIIGELELTG
jgi:hypothetical protein